MFVFLVTCECETLAQVHTFALPLPYLFKKTKEEQREEGTTEQGTEEE